MAKVSTNISLDPNLKRKAVALFGNFGLDLSTAITLFLNQAVREKRIPFEIRMEIPNEETIAAINELPEMEKNKDKYKRYSSFDDLLRDVGK
ncbi:MAG: type II toxin-antitoxin system RelB/DinJ family antitoxin [Bacilli bacterium]|nr:type II toxin-antitoxin system RelB/DinJ family antitoxin [Bacilli bacterium]